MTDWLTHSLKQSRNYLTYGNLKFGLDIPILESKNLIRNIFSKFEILGMVLAFFGKMGTNDQFEI